MLYFTIVHLPPTPPPPSLGLFPCCLSLHKMQYCLCLRLQGSNVVTIVFSPTSTHMAIASSHSVLVHSCLQGVSSFYMIKVKHSEGQSLSRFIFYVYNMQFKNKKKSEQIYLHVIGHSAFIFTYSVACRNTVRMTAEFTLGDLLQI